MDDLAIMAIPEWVHVLSTLIIGIRMTMVLRTHGAQEISPSKIDRVLVEITEHITKMLKAGGAPAMLFDWLRVSLPCLHVCCQWLTQPSRQSCKAYSGKSPATHFLIIILIKVGGFIATSRITSWTARPRTSLPTTPSRV